MTEFKICQFLIDSLKDPVLIADHRHSVIYMNQKARSHYKMGGNLLYTNLLDCHSAISQRLILQIWDKMKNQDLKEELITDNRNFRIYMRVIRNTDGKAVAYYERYEPPVQT